MRKHLTYGNVISTFAVFLVLAGGTAFAASHLGKNSVGSKQLKKNSVTAAKIKKNAVTTAKLKKNSVTNAKIANAAVTEAKIDTVSSGLSRVLTRLRGSSTVSFAGAAVYPLDASGYTQNAGEINQLIAYVDVRIDASCEGGRSAMVLLTRDAADPLKAGGSEVIGAGYFFDESSGTVSRRIQLGSSYPYASAPMTFAAPASPTQRNLAIALVDEYCEAGSGISAVGAGVDVVGIR